MEGRVTVKELRQHGVLVDSDLLNPADDLWVPLDSIRVVPRTTEDDLTRRVGTGRMLCEVVFTEPFRAEES
jgi:hypothetical protein